MIYNLKGSKINFEFKMFLFIPTMLSYTYRNSKSKNLHALEQNKTKFKQKIEIRAPRIVKNVT